MPIPIWKDVNRALLAAALLGLATVAPAQDEILQGEELIDALREGGYVLLMRDPQAERTLPQAPALDERAARGGIDLERLDEDGREQAREVGEALARYEIPLGQVVIGPDQRMRETAELMGLSDVTTDRRLDEEQGASAEAAQWLRDQAGEAPPTGENALYLTHHPNILRAFPELAPRPEEAEIVVVDPDGGEESQPRIISRVRFQDWRDLAG